MDASNPVIDSTRVSLSAMREKKIRYQRQDLGWIDRICSKLPRTKLETYPLKDYYEEDVKVVRTKLKQVVEEHHVKLKSAIDYKDLSPEVLKEFLNTHDPIPVCGLHKDGIPIHPTGRNQSHGKVSATLSFGGVGIDKNTVEALAHYLETRELEEYLGAAPIYTRGTTRGLQDRLRQQMARPVVNSKMSYKNFRSLIDQCMPVRVDRLMDWNSDLYDLFENVKTSFSSSAGAPYWKPKVDALDEMLDVVLPLVADELIKGNLDVLKKEQPELFLCSVKNKDDRYEDPVSKTRPYLSLPWHFQTLFSVLMQGFCDGLHLFHETPGCRNAYGFAYANGGGNKLWDFMNRTKHGKPQFAVYGDDVDFYYRTRLGHLYRVCPDFRQMDGSVDETTVRHTIKWVCDSYAQKFGASQFWDNVAALWVEFTLNPKFIIEGSTVYTKKNSHGIMTGVVGTTLFDTVKAVAAYEEFVTYNPYPDTVSVKNIINFFAKKGLVIKEGTWSPQIVSPVPTLDEPITEQKFLGMQLMCTIYNGNQVFVPTMPEREWFTNLITPKEKEAKSSFGQQRYLFDRLRGLLTTGGVFHRHFRRACNSLLGMLPPSAIVMKVSNGNGKGSRPEFFASVGKDFEFENSSGWPTVEWALDLYAPEEYKQGVPFAPVFIDADKVLDKLPQRKPIMPIAAVVDVIQGGEVMSSSVMSAPVERTTPIVPDINSNARLAEVYEPKEVQPLGHSPRKNIITETGEVKKIARKTIQQQIADILGPVVTKKPHLVDNAFTDLVHHAVRMRDSGAGREFVKAMIEQNKWDLASSTLLGMVLDGLSLAELDTWTISVSAMVSLDHLSRTLGQPERLVAMQCRAMGYYVFGPPNHLYVASRPVAPMDDLYRKDVERQMKENRDRLEEVKVKLRNDPISNKTQGLMQQKKSLVEVVKRAEERPAQLPMVRTEVNPDPNFILKPVANLNARELLNAPKRDKQIGVQKILKHNGIKYRVVHSQTRPGDITVFWKEDHEEAPELEVFKTAGPMNPYLNYYRWALEKYIRDVETHNPDFDPFKNPDKSWADLYQTEKNVRIRLFMEQGRPTILHIKNWKPVIVGDHPYLVTKEGDKNAVYVRTPEADVPVSLKHSISKTTTYLAELLGKQVEVANLTYSEYISSFPDLEPELRARDYIDHLGELAHKGATKDVHKSDNERETPTKGRSPKRSSSGRSGYSGPKGKLATVQEKPTRSRTKSKSTSKTKSKSPPVVHAQAGNQVRGDGWFRLPWNPQFRSQGRYRGGEVDYQYMPYGMGWYPGPAGGPFMAAVPPQEPRTRNNNVRQQDDGRAVPGSLVGRFRRPSGNKGRRRPF